MDIQKQVFGTTDQGHQAEIYTLSNDSGAFVKISNYGGIITDIVVPDKKGLPGNVVAGFDRLDDYQSEDYLKVMPYFGAIIGRYANRINNGQFEIDGEIFTIPCNLGDVALHGGIEGFDKKLWDASTRISEKEASLVLKYLSPNGEEGFPGNLQTEVTYSWNNADELSISYRAQTDRKTHLNLTNHSYFNLNGFRRDILDHRLTIQAEQITETDEALIPTGKLIPVEGTLLDFKSSRRIGERIEEVKGNGYDHNYVLAKNGDPLQLAAIADDEESGRRMEVYTTEPGMQLYTANWLDGTLSRGSIIFKKRFAFCLETQHFPDSPNQPGFPSTLLLPGTTFSSKTVYKFSLL
ncbi:MAG: galactose mutarotase [bacterium]